MNTFPTPDQSASFTPLASGSQINGIAKADLEISGEMAVKLVQDGAQLLDVREEVERASGHAQGDKHIPLGQVAAQASAVLDPSLPVVVYCAGGVRSLRASRVLREAGFSAYSLAKGYPTWIRAGGQTV